MTKTPIIPLTIYLPMPSALAAFVPDTIGIARRTACFHGVSGVNSWSPLRWVRLGRYITHEFLIKRRGACFSSPKPLLPSRRSPCQMKNPTHEYHLFEILVIDSVKKPLAHDLDPNRSAHFGPGLWPVAYSLKSLTVIGLEFITELWVLLSKKGKNLPDIVQRIQ